MKLTSSKSRHFNVSFGIKITLEKRPELMIKASKVWRMRANLWQTHCCSWNFKHTFWFFLMIYQMKTHSTRKSMMFAIIQYQLFLLWLSNVTSFYDINFKINVAVWLFEMAGELGFNFIQYSFCLLFNSKNRLWTIFAKENCETMNLSSKWGISHTHY